MGAGDAGVGLEITFVKDDDILVIVRAVATGGAAPRLVRRVAESIRVDRARAARAAALPRLDVPAPEPRLLGCFEHTVHVEGANAHIVRIRCFRPDSTFTQESTLYATFGSPNTVSKGTWAYADGHLLLEEEDGDQVRFEIAFTDGNVVANGNAWERR